jgi:hypothetical protein
MSVSGFTVSISYAGNGSSNTFSFPGYFMAKADLVVTSTDDTTQVVTILTLGSDYSITAAPTNGVYPDGGSVVLAAPATSAPSGSTLLITRRTPRTQVAVYQTEDPFPAKTHETALDRAILLIQEMMSHYQGEASGAPTSGTFVVGDWFRIVPPIAGGYFGIVCTTAPLTFKTWGPISA